MASSEGPDPDPRLKPQHSTTFVQADPSNFRAVVQRLTGDTAHKLPNSIPFRHTGKPTVHRRSGYKLQERRKSVKKLEITLSNVSQPVCFMSPLVVGRDKSVVGFVGGDGQMVEESPVSTLAVCGRGSPGTPMEKEGEEEKAIAEKGFYLHPSPIREPEPELLVLFPLTSPKNDPSYSS
ncbi:unnamed protein product [Lactuca virosa]|uniref:VQ domain-containing protein n=1 Tax=Lactuca virosa TaxID=75947 RepID=A0AAU9M9V1_9ASTR|nr:unnamed protein product [Lactuca virosa]